MIIPAEDLISIPFGRYGSYFVLINMFILAYGAMVAYLLIIKDTVPVVLDIVEIGEGGIGQVLADNWVNSKLFIGLGVLSTAMACQHSAFIVSGSLEDKTAARWGMVTSRSISISAALCIMMGVTGCKCQHRSRLARIAAVDTS
jgi:amino acid permease